MSWHDELREASFRGVKFGVTDLPGQLGRKVAVHNFVERDEPLVEDMGRLARSFTIEAFVVGPTYTALRDELEAALEEPGPGVFVHPYRGEMLVALSGPVSVREGLSNGMGQAVFTIPFVRVEDKTLPRGSRSALALAGTLGAQAEAASINAINAALNVLSQGAFVFNHAAAEVAAGIFRARSISQGNVVTIVSTAARAFGADEALAMQILSSGLVGEQLYAIFREDLEKSPADGAKNGTNLNDLASGIDDEETAEGSDAEWRLVMQNRAATARFQREAFTRLMIEEYTDTRPESKNDAQRMIADITERSAEVIASAPADDAGEVVAAVFQDLASAAIAAVALAARQSPEVRRYKSEAELPSLYLAHRYATASGDIEALALDFAQRNGEAHPGFCPPGLKEVLLYEN